MSTAGSGAQFGYSVSLSADGNTALVGAIYANSGAGYAAVYRYSGGSWSSAVQLVSTAGAYSYFGYAVSLSADGNTALVGAPGANSYGGYAAVYRYTGGLWSSATTLVSTAGMAYTRFGTAVALSADGNTAFVGAPSSGYAAVYRYTGGSWSTATQLVSTAGSGAHFGASVALSSDGTTALVGAFYGSYAAVFRYTGGAWSSAVQLVSTAGAYSDFGGAVALSADGNTALVGAFYANSGAGYAAIYRYTGGTWSTATQLVSTAGAYSDFGYAVSLSADGNTALVGAVYANSYDGYAAVYRSTVVILSQPILSVLNGNVGIGTAVPQSNLHVVGNALITGTLKSGSISSGSITSGSINTQSGTLTLGTGTITTTGSIYTGSITATNSVSVGTLALGSLYSSFIDQLSSGGMFAGYVGIGVSTVNTNNSLDIGGSASIGYGGTNPTAPTNGLIISSNVGIGTDAPQSNLHVIGDTLLTGTLSSASINTQGNDINVGSGSITLQGLNVISPGTGILSRSSMLTTAYSQTIIQENNPFSAGITLASQTAAAATSWRIKAFGTYAAINSRYTRQFIIVIYWGDIVLTTFSTDVLINTAQTTTWVAEFNIIGLDQNNVYITGYLINQLASATLQTINILELTSSYVSNEAATIDFCVGQASASINDIITVQSVFIERIL